MLFTSEILDYMEANYCVDLTRIMSTGKSDGGGVCNLLACNATLSRRIAAFAPVSGAYYVDELPCDPDRVTIPCAPGRGDVPILAFHGGNDTTANYTGGPRRKQCLPAIPHWIQEWASRDGLDASMNRSTHVASNTTKYSFDPSSSDLVSLVYESDIGHDWPSTVPNADNKRQDHHVASFNATPMILDFFNSHPLLAA